MNPQNKAYTVAMPWYEREDFGRLLELADDRSEFHPSYDVWHAGAMRVAQEYLSRGQVLELILVRPDRFLEWLAARGEPNTSASRLRYVEALAVQQISCGKATFDLPRVILSGVQEAAL